MGDAFFGDADTWQCGIFSSVAGIKGGKNALGDAWEAVQKTARAYKITELERKKSARCTKREMDFRGSAENDFDIL